MTGHRVIVLGAGISGLATARELVERGYEVLVVEARNRVGGRLKGGDLELDPTSTEPKKDDAGEPVCNYHTVDLGGALIHGIEDNPIHGITTQMGVPLHLISDHCLLLDENGWPFDPKEDDKVSKLFNECLDEAFRKAGMDPESKTSFGELFQTVCEKKGLQQNAMLQWHQANLELPSGASFSKLGYTWNDDEQYGFAGDHVALEPSWKVVMEGLAHGLNILYSNPVKEVRVVLPDGKTARRMSYTAAKISPSTQPTVPDNVTEASTKFEDGKFQASTTGGEDKDSKDVVPNAKIRYSKYSKENKTLSVVPDNSKEIAPTRFSRRVKGEDANVRRSNRSSKGVIQMLQVSHDTTLSYDNPNMGYNVSKKRKRSEPKKRLKSDNEVSEGNRVPASTVQVMLQNGKVLEADSIVCTLPLGILKIKDDKPGHVKFVPPLPDPKKAAIEQLGCGLLNKCALSFPTVFWQNAEFLGIAGTYRSYLVLNAMVYTGKPILVFMYGGSFAEELECWTDYEIVKDCLAVLKKICGREVPDPIDYHVTRWGKEKFSRMAFSYIPPGVNGPNQYTEMSEAIYDPVVPGKPLIQFAGEHTTPYHPSTIHGAFLSGIREAYRLDLFMAPLLNNNVTFEAEEKLHQYTFPVRKLFKTTKRGKNVAGDVNLVNSSSVRSLGPQSPPRRQRSVGMTLRKTKKSVIDSHPQITNKNISLTAAASQVSTAKSRRSQRSLAFKKRNVTYDSNQTETEMTDLEKNQFKDALEDRILLRSLESYGRDYDVVCNKVLPVFGSKRRRTIDQIRARWQQHRKQREPSQVLKMWEADKIALSDENNIVNVFPEESGNRRRSSREPKRRVLVDV